jgi:hypothetical protein
MLSGTVVSSKANQTQMFSLAEDELFWYAGLLVGHPIQNQKPPSRRWITRWRPQSGAMPESGKPRVAIEYVPQKMFFVTCAKVKSNER